MIFFEFGTFGGATEKLFKAADHPSSFVFYVYNVLRYATVKWVLSKHDFSSHSEKTLVYLYYYEQNKSVIIGICNEQLD